MYTEKAVALPGKETVKQTELGKILSRIEQSNANSEKYISEIKECLSRIMVYNEPETGEKSPVPKDPDQPGIISAIKNQISFSERNEERLMSIIRHLKTLI